MREALIQIRADSETALDEAFDRATSVKRVHEDVSALSDWGTFEQTEDGKVHVPYDVIHANFDLRAAA
jgi:predicted transcriptional regulator